MQNLAIRAYKQDCVYIWLVVVSLSYFNTIHMSFIIPLMFDFPALFYTFNKY